jgi:hypothetical protein
MPTLDLKTNHKAVKEYYAGLEEFHRLGVTHETAVRAAFQRLLEHCCRQTKWTFVGEYKYLRKGQRPLSVDGAAVDGWPRNPLALFWAEAIQSGSR